MIPRYPAPGSAADTFYFRSIVTNDHAAVNHDLEVVLQHGKILEKIAIDHDEIGDLSLLQGAKLVFKTTHVGAVLRALHDASIEKSQAGI